ncbi:MAG TPA: hypothetical protein VFI95_16770 [Terriglobales bacterium]|jgi:hypothetical protein|nr:hypothetical protein [Terriglobales bacterium]
MPEQQTSRECGFAKSKDGTPICGFHQQPLVRQYMAGEGNPGLPQLSAWICPVSKRLLIGN